MTSPSGPLGRDNMKFRCLETGELFTSIDRMVLDAQKRYKICENLTWCDIECVLKHPTDGTIYILDECGNWEYFPLTAYEIVEEQHDPEPARPIGTCEHQIPMNPYTGDCTNSRGCEFQRLEWDGEELKKMICGREDAALALAEQEQRKEAEAGK